MLQETQLISDVHLLFHGGGWTVGDDVNVPASEVYYLLERGIVVASTQYRLAPQ
jgi:acetyl esterase/lipase